jgi:hypothetical protein
MVCRRRSFRSINACANSASSTIASCNRPTAVPEIAEDFDQMIESRLGIRHRHRLGDPRKATLKRNLIENGFKQSSP